MEKQINLRVLFQQTFVLDKAKMLKQCSKDTVNALKTL